MRIYVYRANHCISSFNFIYSCFYVCRIIIFKTEISNNDDGKNIIKIHLKTPFDNDLKNNILNCSTIMFLLIKFVRDEVLHEGLCKLSR